jgi:hypothetical protein
VGAAGASVVAASAPPTACERGRLAGCGRSRRTISREPCGHASRPTWPVNSATHAPSRGWLSALIAGRHARSGKARIAALTRSSMAYPNEKRTPVSRHASASAWLAPAESERARIGPSSAAGGSCSSASSNTCR